MSYHGKLQVLKQGTADKEIQHWAYLQLEKEPAELTDEEMMKAEYEFMYWNRSLDKPLVEIAYELGVFKQAVAILRKASEK